MMIDNENKQISEEQDQPIDQNHVRRDQGQSDLNNANLPESNSNQTTAQTPIPQAPSGKSSIFTKIIMIIMAIVIVILLVIATYFYALNKPGNIINGNGQISPSPQTTPRVIRQIHPIATNSAFIELDNTINQLTKDLSSFANQDPSLSPPVLDLPLGFSK